MKQRNLQLVLDAHKAHSYQWGKWDCMTFVNDCIGGITKIDHMKNLDAYDSQAGAIRSLKNFGV